METQEIINQVKQENQENDIIMSNQEIKEKVQQQMNKTDNPWLDHYKENDYLIQKKEEITLELFKLLYEGNWEVERPDPCEGCPNKGKICHCTLGSMVIEA